MSLKNLMRKGEDAASAAPEKKPEPPVRRPVTAPGATAMMQPTIDALNARAKKAEGRVAELEARIADLEATSIPVGSVVPNPWQPRRVFDEEEIQRLAESIAEIGLIQPIVVRRKSVTSCDTAGEQGGGEDGVTSCDTYELVAGERRLRAHKVLGAEQIKAVVIEADDSDLAVMSLAENLDRADLTDYEISLAIRRAEREFPSRSGMAKALGIQRGELYRYLTFQDLPVFMQEDLALVPALLGRSAAGAIVSAIGKIGPGFDEAVRGLWERVKSGHLDQTKMPAMISSLPLADSGRGGDKRDIRKLFVGDEHAGSITRDGNGLTVKIKTVALTPEKEDRLREFIESLLKS